MTAVEHGFERDHTDAWPAPSQVWNVDPPFVTTERTTAAQEIVLQQRVRRYLIHLPAEGRIVVEIVGDQLDRPFVTHALCFFADRHPACGLRHILPHFHDRTARAARLFLHEGAIPARRTESAVPAMAARRRIEDKQNCPPM
jgi:hypothetical protein